MNINFSQITNIFKKGKGGGYGLGESPSLDWLIALGCFFLLTALGVFLTITNRPGVNIVSDTVGGDSQVFSQPILDRVLEKYTDKQKQFDALLKNPPNLVDPSL